MDLTGLDSWFRGFLDFEGWERADASLNGVQVGRSPGEVTTVAFAVDACLESMRRARDAGAQVLFVHHGIFWGKNERVVGPARERLRFLLEHDLALYACHGPLDAAPVVGNNAVLCRLLGLEALEPFGFEGGKALGLSGRFPAPLPLDEAVRRVLPDGTPPRSLLAFGPRDVRTAAVVSGCAIPEFRDAAAGGIDLYVTGESSHEFYHAAEEAGVNVLCAGHYATETHGVRAVADKLALETGIAAAFIDLPTGL